MPKKKKTTAQTAQTTHPDDDVALIVELDERCSCGYPLYIMSDNDHTSYCIRCHRIPAFCNTQRCQQG